MRTLAPDVHASTVYRNLEELERLGVVIHNHLGHGAATYHLATEAHGHLVCEVCGDTIEAPEDLFEAMAEGAKRRLGFELRPYHFAVLGVCAVCAKAAPAPEPPGLLAAPVPIRHQPLDLEELRRRVVDLEGRVLDVEALLEEALEVEPDRVAVVAAGARARGRRATESPT